MDQEALGPALRREALALADELGRELGDAIRAIDGRATFPRDPDDALRDLDVPLPREGIGARAALERLAALNERAGANLGGPRCFHFVIGGSTPAALGADLLATVWETVTYSWIVSPLGVRLERLALAWLQELFGLPAAWTGVMVTGGTMADFVGLCAGRQWWGEQHGRDVTVEGMTGLPPLRVLTSGYVHAAALKCLGMLGIGHANVQRFERDGQGRLDLAAFERAVEALDGAPALVLVNAGEVNAGDFDPTEAMIASARRGNCWVHVDGAFGLFARLSDRTAHLVRGVEDADSVAVDGHKWLNVPYDSGYAFVRDRALLAKAFRYSAAYLPVDDELRPTIGSLVPESSRRARSFAVWATLQAYGRDGYRALVEHCLELAQYVARRVEASAELELVDAVRLNIVPFRFVGEGGPAAELDLLNTAIVDALNTDGTFLVGGTRLAGRTVLRPAFCNWRTRTEDVDGFVDAVVAHGRRLQGAGLRAS